jgi:hypothetical protein
MKLACAPKEISEQVHGMVLKRRKLRKSLARPEPATRGVLEFYKSFGLLARAIRLVQKKISKS